MPLSRLPTSLADALRRVAESHDIQNLARSAAALSKNYRNTEVNLTQRFTGADAAAYAAVRMPATFAAVSVALEALRGALGATPAQSLLDVGAGPGTATFAAAATLPALKILTQIEKDPAWTSLAAQLDAAMHLTPQRKICDLTATPEIAGHDIVTCCYTLNEIPAKALDRTIEWLWRSASLALVLVEPGSPRGFETILRARRICLAQGGHIAAPCTHDNACPMTGGDWCHFTARLERSVLHRNAKGAELSHEDEKFSYLVVTRAAPAQRQAARLIRNPIRAGGHVHLDLCMASGLVRTTVGKSDKANYRNARNAEWGDAWPPYDAA